MAYHFTHCALRLGDNLAHLHFLRKLSLANPDDRFVHFAHERYLSELEPVIFDIPRISLVPLRDPYSRSQMWPNSVPPLEFHSLDAWKNAGGAWQAHPKRLDYAGFMLDHFRRLAAQMGFASPFKSAADLLFDYPLLKMREREFSGQKFFLVINSPAQSGQASRLSLAEFDQLIGDLHSAGHRVVTTAPCSIAYVPCTATGKMSVTGIGRLSQYAEAILMISTGPSWPTFNVWNQASVRRRIVLIDSEKIDLSPNTEHCAEIAQARNRLKFYDYLK